MVPYERNSLIVCLSAEASGDIEVFDITNSRHVEMLQEAGVLPS